MLLAYEGDKPFIFISYSHRNSRYIHGVIEYLQNEGYRVWYDGGIEAGSEWPEYIASHLERCACVLTFMSHAFVESDNCKRELHFAQDLKKPLLNVYIENVNLSAGLRMQLGLCQAMYRENFRTEGEFLQSLGRAKILEDCREPVLEPVVMAPVNVAIPQQPDDVWSGAAIAEDDTDEELLGAYEEDLKEHEDEIDDLVENPSEEPETEVPPMTGGMRLLGWLAILVELSYCYVGPKALELATASEMGVWMLILVMAVPHIVIAIINKLLIKAMAGKTTSAQRDNFVVPLFFLSVVTALAATIIGISRVQYELAGIVRFLIALGLNVIPAAVAFCMYALMMTVDD